ncbi:MAG: endonuclease/exonuclease/phosphatase family protein [Bacteroidales bacterium]|jgi:endonuclease/exonuclease/phosphatase family metal-dependent hydrolase|nr:endonuclease/exonuclease/phosphatase family protein [Bacteroidales bacterium]
MFKRIIYIINLVFVLLLLGAYAGAYVSPVIYDKLSLLTYIYPFLLLINVLFCILWLFIKIRFIIIPLLAILLQVNYIPRLIQFSLNTDEEIEEIKDNKTDNILHLVTYNVCGFGFEKGNKEERLDSLLQIVKQKEIDVIVMQDFPRISTKHILHKKIVNAGFKYFFCLDLTKNIMDKSVIYSKYPIGQTGGLLPSAEEPDEFMYADIQKNNREFRIFNIHLESYLLLAEEKSMTNEIKNLDVVSSKKRWTKFQNTVINKVLSANTIRSQEVNELTEVIKETKKPYMIVGDFNDNPFSYSYRKLSKGLTDCFVKKGKGFGITYDKVFPPFRIDYVLVSKEFETLSYNSPQYNFSDHYPIFVTLKIL